jgi:hypothetical protein
MNLPRIVVDNSAMLPAFFPEAEHNSFDAGLVTNRARALVQAIRTRRVNAFVPPSFFREFLNTATWELLRPGGWDSQRAERIRAQWDDLLSLNLIVIPLHEILHHSATLVFENACPAPDAWYVAAAVHARAVFWMSHEHRDGLVKVASTYVAVRLLSQEAVDY